jgi:Region found in RelA / SpoT proteins
LRGDKIIAVDSIHVNMNENLISEEEMAWATLKHTRNQVDKAGDILIAEEHELRVYWDALDVINNWRASHSFPLNTFTIGLKRKAKEIDSDALVAQRIKRLSSIAHKLERFGTMQLSQMQDIGGCRAIVATLDDVKKLISLQKSSKFKHKLVKENDYIAKPKTSGYRGVHLIYRYHSDRSENYNGLQIEMQFRSAVQHAWATAVETVGTLVQQALKSSIGTDEWLRFFALMGTAIAWRENAAAVPGTPETRAELVNELRGYAEQRALTDRLRAYGAALHTAEQSSATDTQASYFLLKLDPSAHEVTVTGFKKGQLESASKQYLEVEKDIKDKQGQDAVLVSVDSVASLRRAYPNYFLDTTSFIDLVNDTIGHSQLVTTNS